MVWVNWLYYFQDLLKWLYWFPYLDNQLKMRKQTSKEHVSSRKRLSSQLDVDHISKVRILGMKEKNNVDFKFECKKDFWS